MENKNYLENLIALLESYKADNAGIVAVLNSLNELNALYNTVLTTSSETKAVTDKEKNMTTLDNGSAYSLSPEQLKQISDKVAEIRKKVIQ